MAPRVVWWTIVSCHQSAVWILADMTADWKHILVTAHWYSHCFQSRPTPESLCPKTKNTFTSLRIDIHIASNLALRPNHYVQKQKILLRHYSLIFTLLPISPYTKITWSKNIKHFRVTIAVLIVYIWYMSIGNPEACFFGGGSRSQWQISPALTPCFHPKVLVRILSHLIFQFIEIVVT